MVNLSPTVMLFDGFAFVPETVTFPPLIASTATRLVLKNRAAQSHLSSRTVPTLLRLSVTLALLLNH